MLNSKYAPVIALTVLGIVVIGVLGWFLAIKPQLDEAAALRADEDLVKGNLATIQADAASIAQAESDLSSLVDLQPAIGLNAPARFDLEAFRTRVWEAIVSSGVEVLTVDQDSAYEVAGWEIPPVLLPSTDLAKRFQSGPAPTTQVTPEPHAPVVTVTGESQSLAPSLAGVPTTITAVGTADEVHDFIDALQDPSQPLFLAAELTAIALEDGSNVGDGISDQEEGNLQITVSGVSYLADIDRSLVDDGELPDAPRTGADPFERPEEDAPEQPGAN